MAMEEVGDNSFANPVFYRRNAGNKIGNARITEEQGVHHGKIE
jgi:hypothetical protein